MVVAVVKVDENLIVAVFVLDIVVAPVDEPVGVRCD